MAGRSWARHPGSGIGESTHGRCAPVADRRSEFVVTRKGRTATVDHADHSNIKMDTSGKDEHPHPDEPSPIGAAPSGGEDGADDGFVAVDLYQSEGAGAAEGEGAGGEAEDVGGVTESVRPAWVDDDLFPFESRFVDIDGHTVHYVDEGSGPTLLFLHGNPTWSFLWRDVIRALRDDFRCVALDYPGFGLSTPMPGYRYLPEEHADVVTGFVDSLGLEGVTLVGQDWGGLIGLAAVQRRPGVFDRLVLADTWAWPTNGVLHFEYFSRIFGGPPAASWPGT